MPVAYECRGCGMARPEHWTGPCCDHAPIFKPSDCRDLKCRGCHRRYDTRRVQSSIPGAKLEEPIDGQVMSLQDAVEGAIEYPRIETGIAGFDYVFGDDKGAIGMVPGSVVLVCGSPGGGKTTLLLGVLQALARQRYDVLYVTGEESMNQLGRRAKSLGKFPARFRAVHETDLDTILDQFDDVAPDAFVADSIQKIRVGDDYEPESPASIKYAIEELGSYAKREHAIAFIIGHITKDGAIRGAKTLEHDVDVVLYLENLGINPNGSKKKKKDSRRLLRCDSKNRFGETPRAAPFEMTGQGLRDLYIPGWDGWEED